MTMADVFHVFLVLTMSRMAIAYSSSLLPDISKERCSAASMFESLDRHWLLLEKAGAEFIAAKVLRPDAGSILIDGVDIRKMQMKWLKRQMGLVCQEPVLFKDTIRENIAYGKEDKVTEAEIVAAAELANAHNFICCLEQGYDTIVGERRIQLPGGQKQKVAIARAIIKAPKILLLDEAASALDPESERFVQEALDKVAVNRTTVVAGHRLSTITGGDLIAVVKHRGIAEIGSHESLVNREDGIYASLVALQSSAEP